MELSLNEGEYVFCTVQEKDISALKSVLIIFKEQEGLTIVLPKQEADTAGMSHSSFFPGLHSKCIRRWKQWD